MVLTYDYAISYSIASKRNWADYEAAMVDGAGDLMGRWEADFSESYIVEREPEKEGTVLLPAEKPADANDYLRTAEDNRVPLGAAGVPAPARAEEAVLGPHSTPLLASILAFYLSSHIYYFGAGFSQVDGRSRQYWISLALVVPLAMALAIAAALGLLLFLVL